MAGTAVEQWLDDRAAALELRSIRRLQDVDKELVTWYARIRHQG